MHRLASAQAGCMRRLLALHVQAIVTNMLLRVHSTADTGYSDDRSLSATLLEASGGCTKVMMWSIIASIGPKCRSSFRNRWIQATPRVGNQCSPLHPSRRCEEKRRESIEKDHAAGAQQAGSCKT